MRIIIIDKEKNRIRFNHFIDWLINMVGYALILIALSLIFKKTIYIDPSYYGFWGLIAAIVVYILNKTIKPVIFWLTLPITGLTYGLFYLVINVFILNITDYLLGSHFIIQGFWMSCIVAALISVMNVILDEVVLKPLLRKGK